MSIVFMTGFEAGDKTYYTTRGWTFGASDNVGTATWVHKSLTNNGGSYRCWTDDGCTSPTFSTTARWLNLAFFPTSYTAITFRRSGADTFGVQLTGSGVVNFRRGTATSATIVATASKLVNMNVAHWISIELVAADAGGTCTVKIDGEQYLTFSGDTKAATTADWDQFSVDGANNWTYFDDVIVTTAATGEVTESFIPGLVPDGNDVTAFTSSSGNPNWQNVNEIPPSTTQYNETLTAPAEETYTLTNLPWSPPASTIKGVQVTVYAARDGVITQAQAVTRPTTTSFYGTATNLPAAASYGMAEDIRITNPDTAAAWTEAQINALKAGIKFL